MKRSLSLFWKKSFLYTLLLAQAIFSEPFCWGFLIGEYEPWKLHGRKQVSLLIQRATVLGCSEQEKHTQGKQ